MLACTGGDCRSRTSLVTIVIGDVNESLEHDDCYFIQLSCVEEGSVVELDDLSYWDLVHDYFIDVSDFEE